MLVMVGTTAALGVKAVLKEVAALVEVGVAAMAAKGAAVAVAVVAASAAAVAVVKASARQGGGLVAHVATVGMLARAAGWVTEAMAVGAGMGLGAAMGWVSVAAGMVARDAERRAPAKMVTAVLAQERVEVELVVMVAVVAVA